MSSGSKGSSGNGKGKEVERREKIGSPSGQDGSSDDCGAFESNDWIGLDWIGLDWILGSD